MRTCAIADACAQHACLPAHLPMPAPGPHAAHTRRARVSACESTRARGLPAYRHGRWRMHAAHVADARTWNACAPAQVLTHDRQRLARRACSSARSPNRPASHRPDFGCMHVAHAYIGIPAACTRMGVIADEFARHDCQNMHTACPRLGMTADARPWHALLMCARDMRAQRRVCRCIACHACTLACLHMPTHCRRPRTVHAHQHVADAYVKHMHVGIPLCMRTSA